MTEATTSKLQSYLIILLIFSIHVLFPICIQAQPSQANLGFGQLLDSAEILKLKGEFVEATAICEQVKIESEESKDWASTARSLSELAEINRYYDEFEICQELLNQSKEIIETYLDTLHVEMARNLFYLGKLQRFLGDEDDGYPNNVLFSYHEAERILRRIGNAEEELALVLLDIGRFYSEYLFEAQKAKEYFFEIETIMNNSNDKISYLRGFMLYYTGAFYRNIGDYERSTLVLSLAKTIFNDPRNYDLNRILKCEIVLANNYFDKDELPQALLYYKHVIDNNKEVSFDNFLTSLMNTGIVLLKRNEIDSSISYLEKAMRLFNSKNDTRYDTKSRLHLYLGLAFAEKEKFRERDKYFDAAIQLSINKIGAKSYRTHVIYRRIGEYFEVLGMLDRALELYQKGLIALFEDFNSHDIYKNPDYKEYENPEEVFYILTEKSGALYKRYLKGGNLNDLKAAYELYLTGYDLLEKLLNAGMMDESMIQVFLGFKEAFNLSIECAFDLYSETDETKYFHQAFQFIEKSKYFLLFKTLANTLYKQNSGTARELFIRDRELDHDINALKYKLNLADEKEDNTFSLRNFLLDKLIEKTAIKKQIEDESMLDPISFMDSLVLEIDEIQVNLVEENELIIEYHWSENHIYALTFCKEKFDFFKIKIDEMLLNQLDNYAFSISGEELDGSMDEYLSYINSAHYLHQKLFEPAIKNLNDDGIFIDHITIVPDKKLSYLPFESLLTAYPDTTDVIYLGLPYLLNKFTIRYAYSLNILKDNLNSEQQIEEPQLLALSYSSELDKFGDTLRLRAMDEIRYSAEELNSIKSWVSDGAFYEDVEATEALFKNQASNFSLIHLALHGQADITDKYNSKLIFKVDSTIDEDGELFAFELYDIDLRKTEMAVLSACETGIGQQIEGEGIFSIARGFAFAGCPSIVMSLWKVSDKTTAKIMGYFYENLAKNLPKDVALQNAKKMYILQAEDITAHPSTWAAFISLGNNKPIHLPHSRFNTYAAIVALLFLVSLIYFFYFHRKKRNLS